MLCKVFRTGNRIVVSLPPEVLEYLDIREGSEVEVSLDRENQQIVMKPVETPFTISGVNENFALQIAEFIKQYRPALEELVK